MKKAVLLFSLVVALAMPAMAGVRDDDSRGARDFVSRVVRFMHKLVGHTLDDILPQPPRP